MTEITRRSLVAGATAAGATVAAALPLRKPRAQGLQGIDSLQRCTSRASWTCISPPPTAPPARWRTIPASAVVLNLWATWCVPCVREMPALDDLAGLVARDGVVVLPVSSDRGGADTVQRFYADRGIRNLPVLLDPQSRMAHGLGVSGIPTTLLIDRDGRELAWLEGAADWSSADAVTVVRKIAG